MQYCRVSGADVWSFDLTGTSDDGWALLDDAEREEFGPIRAATARRARVATRALLRRLLGRRLGLAPKDVPLSRTAAGKPVLGTPAPIEFSVSHTTGRAAIAIAATAVGVDIERQEPAAFREAASVFLHARERRALGRLDDRAADDLLAALWTGKEAVAKALGTGFLHLDPSALEFAPLRDGPPRPHRVPGIAPGDIAVSWLQPDPDHLIAVALLGRGRFAEGGS